MEDGSLNFRRSLQSEEVKTTRSKSSKNSGYAVAMVIKESG